LPEPGSATAGFCRFQISEARASMSWPGPKRSSGRFQLIRSRALTRPGLGRMNCVRLLPTKWNRRGEPPRRSTAPPAVARQIPGRYRHVIPYSSIIRTFSPSSGHSLDKTARSVGGWSTRRIVDRHHRMTLDGKGRRQ
jgi:hypothetical protein